MKFTVGPVEMYEETLKLRGEQIPYFRTSEFGEMMFRTDGRLKELIGCEKEGQIVYLTASGTGAMESVVINCFDERDKVLVVNGGSFGARFSSLCGIHRINHEEIKVPFEKDLEENMLTAYENAGYTALLVNINETSLGKLYDINLLSQFCKRNNMYLIVDAIGSLFMDEIDMKKTGIDGLIFSSQKALSLAPGMSYVALSKKLLEERVYDIETKCMYLDFKDHIKNFERGQTPFTPAVGICYELSNMVDRLYEKGIEKIVNEKRELASGFRRKVKDYGFAIPEYRLSNALTPVLFKDHAYDVYVELKDRYNLIVNPSGGEYANRMLRIGHMGNLKPSDYEELLEKMIGLYKEYDR